MKRFIVMTCGYAEDAQVSVLIYQCGFFGNPGYVSIKQAITDLALDMYAKFQESYCPTVEQKECCRLTLVAEKTAKFCMFCRADLQEGKFDYQEFMDYVRAQHASTCDSCGSAEYANGRDLTWYPYWIGDFIGAPKEDIIYIAENAEEVLLHALYDAKPELKDEDAGFWGSEDWVNYFSKDKQPPHSASMP